MLSVLKSIIGYVRGNLYQIVNLIEALFRVAAGVCTLTPSVNDGVVVDNLKEGFGKLKGFLSGDGA